MDRSFRDVRGFSTPTAMVRAALLLRIREVLALYVSLRNGYSEIFYGFPQFVYINSGTVSHDHFLPYSFQFIAGTILPFDVT
jgi:hypothetical protein